MRLFTAIPLPGRTETRLHKIQSGRINGIRWQKGDLHLTLVFIGSVDHKTGDEISERLAGITLPPFDITIRGTGIFPTVEHPRVLWAGIGDNESLMALQEANRKAISQFGVKIDDKPYSPHITLAKLKSPNRMYLNKFLVENSEKFIDRVVVDRFGLFESNISSKGAIHQCLRYYSLGSYSGL